MPEQPEKLDISSLNVVDFNRANLKELFPEVFTEHGKIDFDRLKLTLGESVDSGKERFGLVWPGKADCFKTIQQTSTGALLPQRDESVDFDSTENLILEGDNLEVLKLLQKAYLRRVKMIYIDPPYNTGGDFIYPDNFSESLQTYLEFTGQIDGEGKKLSTNTESDGRFHSKWLNMMYPRLFLARNLLREDGVIFISIDDHEVDNLRKLCNEIYGEENFLGCIIWQKKYAPANDTIDLSTSHDYILAYAKTRPVDASGNIVALLAREERTDDMNKAYANPDNDKRGAWKPGDYTCNKSADERPNLYYPITQPLTGEEIWPKKSRVWAYSKEQHEKNVADARLWWGKEGKNKVPAYKRFLTDVGGVVAQTVWLWDEAGHNDEAKKEVQSLFPDAPDAFETPKPTRLIRKLLSLGAPGDNDVVLDFFGGSGTTAHAVLQRNRDENISNKFILVQLPEPTGRKEFVTIADLTRERVRRVIKRLNEEKDGLLDLSSRAREDLGFRAFRLQSSSFNLWQAAASDGEAGLAKQLELHVSHVAPGRSQDALLFEILLKSGFPITTQVETKMINDQNIHCVADGALVVCLEKRILPETIKHIANLKPERVVCLDEGFGGNDQLKTNAVQTMKAKGVTSFRTV